MVSMTDRFDKPWSSYTYVAFDTETSGAFPIGCDICEIAAVKWQNGKVIDRFQSFVAVPKPMSEFIIGIHGITNEMVKDAPSASKVVKDFRDFVSGTIMVAHHAPFDLGFLAYEMEKNDIKLPYNQVLCTSLLSIELFPDFENHKLQTLVKLFDLKKGQAHRALDDSQSCLEVFLKCAERVSEQMKEKTGEEANLADIFEAQKVLLKWDRFSIKQLTKIELFRDIVESVEKGKEMEVIYGSGSHPGQTRRVQAAGIVRSPDGDFLACPTLEEGVIKNKRLYLKRITKAKAIN